MKRVFRDLNYYAKKMFKFAGLLALLFIPLSIVIATWASKLSESEIKNICEVESKNTTNSINAYIDDLKVWSKGYHENTFSVFTSDIIVAVPIKIKDGSLSPVNLDFNDSLIKELGLSRESVTLSLQPAFNELAKTALHSGVEIAANKVGKLNLWSLSVKTSETDLLIVTAYPRNLIRYAQDMAKCDFIAFTTVGQLLLENKNLNINYDQLFTFILENPIDDALKPLQVDLDRSTSVEIRKANANIKVASIADHSAAGHIFRRVLTLFCALGLITYLLALIPLSRSWFMDLQTSKLMTSTIDDFGIANFSTRPRLFLTNHYMPLEQSIDKLGLFLEEFKTLGSSLLKSGLTPLQLRELIKKSQVREVVAVSMYLPALNESATTASESLALFNEISEVFSKATRKNNGILDFTTPQHFQSIWGLVSESEFDSANAGMTALELKVALTKINDRLIAAKLKPIIFGIGAHRAPAQIGVMGSDQTKSLSILGDPNYESLSLARLAAQAHTDILISEVMATLTEAYFVLALVQDLLPKDVRLYTIQGYVDNQDNPILIRSRKLS